MLERTSKGFRAFFLLQFTSELIRHSNGAEFLMLNETSVLQKKDIKEKVHEKIKEEERITEQTISGIKKLTPSKSHGISQRRPAPQQIMVVPEHPLPPRLQYIQPVPTESQIDIGELNPLIQDPMVRSIECDGPDQNIMVRGATNQLKTTAIILNEEQINQIIDKFSKASKIPVSGGVFRVVVGRLILSAITSEVIGSKFIIRKLMLPRTPMYPTMPRRPENFRR